MKPAVAGKPATDLPPNSGNHSMLYHLGKQPARPLPPKAIKFADVFHSEKMPVPPMVFGHHALVEKWYGLGNDTWGNCVWVAKAHMHMLWSLMGGYPRDRFTILDTLSDYHDQAGFVIDDPSTDQGTDLQAAAEYHRKIGVRDATNTRRRVDSYVALTPGDTEQLALAVHIFGAVEIGLALSNDAEVQFERGQPWHETNSEPIGGHCVTIVGRDADGFFLCVTWGRLHRISPTFIETYMDEGYAYLNDEILNQQGLSREAYDKPALARMLAGISKPVNRTAAHALALSPEAMDNAGYPTQAQFDVAFKILRAAIDRSGYGFMLSDKKLKPFADEIAIGVVGAV